MNKNVKPFFDRAKDIYELKELERLGLTPDMNQREQILLYISLLFKWNNVAGLISKADEEVLFLRHFCDSLQPLLLFGFKKNATLLDIGSGGGFPSIPIRIFRPDLTVTLTESNKKKAAFLKEVKKEIQLNNLTIYNGRVESMPIPEKRFDYVISRGVGSLQNFAATAKQFLAPEGHMYTFKTKKFTAELELITSNKEKEGIKISEIAEYDLGNQILGFNLVSLEICPNKTRLTQNEQKPTIDTSESGDQGNQLPGDYQKSQNSATQLKPVVNEMLGSEHVVI